MKIVFCVSLIGILYTYAGYPAAIWCLALLRPHRWSVASIAPSVSIVLAVHNGVRMLRRKIDDLLAADYPNIKEIIIVSDGSTDGTAELLDEYSQPYLVPIVLKEHVGKAVALNAGMAKAQAELILFVDVRPTFAQGAIQHLVNNFADPAVGCVTGELILEQEGHDDATAAVGGVYWRYEQWIRTCEALRDSTVGVYGGFYAIRRELATEQPAGLILDDVFQPLSIVRRGYRAVLDSHAYVYDTWPREYGGEFHRKVRTLAGNFQLFQLAPWSLTLENRLFFQLVSHKLMRLVAPYLIVLFIIATLALSAKSGTYAALGALQLLGLAVALAGLRFRIPLLHHFAGPASGLLMLNAAAVVGFHRFLFTRGPLWKIWNSSKARTSESTHQPGNVTVAKPVSAAAATNPAQAFESIRIARRERSES